jgi:drug/metabolite transporter (DMT)-like permease
VLWSALAALTTATRGIPPFELLALTFGLGGALGCAWLLWPRGPGWRALRQPAPAAALAIGALFAYHALYFVALRSAPPVEANLVNYLWPLLIVVFAALLPGVRVRGRQWLGTLLGLAGAALVVSGGRGVALRPEHVPGYLAALGAALTWSAYSVLNRRYAAVPSDTIAGSCLAVGVLAALAHALFESWVAPSAAQWLVIATVAVGPVGAAFWFWDRGTKHGDIALLGTLSYAAPLLSTALLLLAGRAEPRWTQAAALSLLLTGAWLSVRSAARAPAPASVPTDPNPGAANR